MHNLFQLSQRCSNQCAFVREVHLCKQICILVTNNHYWKIVGTFESMVLEGKENEDKFLIFKRRELYHIYTNKLNITTSNLIYHFISFIKKKKNQIRGYFFEMKNLFFLPFSFQNSTPKHILIEFMDVELFAFTFYLPH